MDLQTQLAKEICLTCQFSCTETLCSILPKIPESFTGKPRCLQGVWVISYPKFSYPIKQTRCPFAGFWKCPALFANYMEELEELKTETSASRHQKCKWTWLTLNSSTNSFMGISVCPTRLKYTHSNFYDNWPQTIILKNQLFYSLVTQQPQYLALYKATLDNEKWS